MSIRVEINNELSREELRNSEEIIMFGNNQKLKNNH